MDLRIEQECPQCGAPVICHESSTMFRCAYCGVGSILQSEATSRYYLPPRLIPPDSDSYLFAPYLRLRGSLFEVREQGIAFRILDTTRLGFDLPVLPVSLGLRPQAMALKRVTASTPARFLRMTSKLSVVRERVVRLYSPPLDGDGYLAESGSQSTMIHVGSKMEDINGSHHQKTLLRAFVGDTASVVYLPLFWDGDKLIDSTREKTQISRDQTVGLPMRGVRFNPRWQVRFLPLLCPGCGWNLDGEEDSLIFSCDNCETLWETGPEGIRPVPWRLVEGDRKSALYLGFWKISAHLPQAGIYSFADFVIRTNQSMVPRKNWYERVMSFWIPAFKIKPDIFLRVARQTTLGQWRLKVLEGGSVPRLFPVTLPSREAREALAVVLAACAIHRKAIFPVLPELQPSQVTTSLVYLPFADRGHDWYQPHTGTTVAKAVLRYGRRL